MLVRWMSYAVLKYRTSSEELPSRIGEEPVGDVVRRGRLRWFGHVERKSEDDWVKKCLELEIAGKAGRGRCRKTWLECVKGDMNDVGVCKADAKDRVLWKVKIPSETSKLRKPESNRKTMLMIIMMMMMMMMMIL